MGMPKGKKIEEGYSTVGKGVGGNDYRTISKAMTESGCKMNHATARNEFLRAMSKIAIGVCKSTGRSLTSVEIQSVAKNPMFQSATCELVQNMEANKFFQDKE